MYVEDLRAGRGCLVDSKKFVGDAPQMMKERVPKEEAEEIVETMKVLNAVMGIDHSLCVKRADVG